MEIKQIVWDKVVLEELKDISDYLKFKPEQTSKIISEI